MVEVDDRHLVAVGEVLEAALAVREVAHAVLALRHDDEQLAAQPVQKEAAASDPRVGLGAVAPTVLLVDQAAKALIGSKLDDAALDAAAAACSDACKPIDDKRGTIKYRTKIAGVLLKRSAMIARDRINGIEHRGHRPV